MTGYFSDDDGVEYGDDGPCPHCDVVLMFELYQQQGWDNEEIVAEIIKGLAAVVATAPDDAQGEVIKFIQDAFPAFVQREATNTAVAQSKHNTQH